VIFVTSSKPYMFVNSCSLNFTLPQAPLASRTLEVNIEKYSTVQYSTVQYSTVQYSTVHDRYAELIII
jgi:hypothetical protein